MQNYMYIFEIVITFIEGLVLLLFLRNIFENEKQDKKALSVVNALVYTAVITFINSYSIVSIQGILAMIIILSIEACLLCRCKFLSALTAATVIVVLQGMLEMLVICGISVLKHDADYVLKIISTVNTFRVIYIIFIKMSVVSIYFFSCGKLRKLNPGIMDNKVFRIITVVGFFLNIKVSELLNTNQFTELKLGLCIMFIGFIVSIILITFIIQKLIEKMEKEKEQDLFSLKNNLLEYNMKNLSLLYEENAKKIHDFNNHINAMNIMLENKQTDRLREYISNLSTSKVYKPVYICKNEMLNTIFNIKISESEKKNIRFNINIDINKDINVDDFDLCGLFMNVLDNAIEAAEAEKDKVINVDVKQRANLIYISVENYCSKNPILARFITSKKGSHGWGTKIVEDIAAKYSGVIDHEYKNNRYTVYIMISEKISPKQ